MNYKKSFFFYLFLHKKCNFEKKIIFLKKGIDLTHFFCYIRGTLRGKALRNNVKLKKNKKIQKKY